MKNKAVLSGRLTGVDAMEKERIPRLVLQFTLTTLIALVFNSVYTLTDALFVSWGVGDNAFGGVSVVLPFTMLQGAISTAIGGGAASLVSRRLGENDNRAASETAFNAFLTFYASAVVITALCFAFKKSIIQAFGVTDELYPYAEKYFVTLLCGNVFSTGFSSIIRAEGKKLYGLLIWIIPVSVNIVLDAVFIFACRWGVFGSALATVICQFTSFSMSVFFFLKLSSLKFKGVRPSFKLVRSILAVGLPSLVQMGSLSVLTLLLNNVIKIQSGTVGINAYSYVSKIISFAIVPIIAVAQGIAPVVGYNFGRQNRLRVKECNKFALVLAVCYAVLALAVLEIIPEWLLKLFTKDADIIALGKTAIRIVSISLPLAVLPYLSGVIYQAEGKKILALVINASCLAFLLALIFPLQRALGLDGVWWSYAAAFLGSTLLSAVLLLVDAKKTAKVECGIPVDDDRTTEIQ